MTQLMQHVKPVSIGDGVVLLPQCVTIAYYRLTYFNHDPPSHPNVE